MRFVLMWMVVIALLPMLAEAAWLKDTVGSDHAGFAEIDIGNGRNDGIQRLYTSSYDGHVREWYYEGGKWVMTYCGAGPLDKMLGLWIGDGRNDGVNRVYAAHSKGLIYEFTYTAGSWVMDTVDATIGYGLGGCVGAGRDDDTNRVYAAGWPNQREYTWDGAGWRQFDLSNHGGEPRTCRTFIVADGRNDGARRVYGAYQSPRYVIEHSWANGAYTEEVLASSGQVMKIVAGQARGDGLARLYASVRFDHVYEYTYESNAWRRIDVHPGAESLSRYGLYIGSARADGKPRLYSAAQRGAAVEHSWTGSSWSDSTIDAVSGATGDIAVGVGRNDGIPRVYVCGFWVVPTVFEFTNTEFVAVSSNTDPGPPRGLVVKIFPNPFTAEVVVKYMVPKRAGVQVAIFDASGAEVYKLVDELQDAGMHSARFSGFSARGAPLAPGVYFCRVQCGSLVKTVKLVKLY